MLRLDHLQAKLEHLNPTGSFKDRGSVAMVNMAKECGISNLVEDSSGNAGASIAAYSTRAEIKAHIFAPSDAPPTKILQIRSYGGRVHLVDGPRDAAATAAAIFCKERGFVYASHSINPYFLAGIKSFSYEIISGLGNGQLPPDHIIFPVGNASLFIGAWKGLKDLRDVGKITKIPRMHCIQTNAVKPIVAAYQQQKWNPSEALETTAGGIAISRPVRLEQVLEILRATNGVAISVSEQEIIRWYKLLPEKDGVFAEPTSTVVLAGLERLLTQGVIEKSESVLVPITGSGLKDIDPVP